MEQNSKEKIFTTDDGVDLYEGEMWILSTVTGSCTSVSVCKNPFRGIQVDQFKYFSTKEAAQEYYKEYFLMNKCEFSINEVLQALRNIFESTGEFKPSSGLISTELKRMAELKLTNNPSYVKY